MIPEWAQIVIAVGLLAMVVAALITLLKLVDPDK